MVTYPLLQRLEDAHVLYVVAQGPGFRFGEACDGYFYEDLTPLELLRLSNELMDLALNAIDPEG